MFNFLLHNCLMHWFWSILLLVTNIFIDIQATTFSWFFFCLLLSHSVLPIPGVPAAPELTSPSPIYNYHVLPGFVNSNPLASVSTCIHGSITYVIVMAYNIYWVIAIMCQALCNWYNCLSCLIQSTSNTYLNLTVLIFKYISLCLVRLQILSSPTELANGRALIQPIVHLSLKLLL